jgi:hypothetical protein
MRAILKSFPITRDNLGRYSACRRMARTIYVGSAPMQRAANRGIDDWRVKLGCVQPGETVATFGDALRRLTDRATYLYIDGRRYSYSTQPTVTRLADDRAGQLSDDDVRDELEKRLRDEARSRGEFAKIHACAPSGVMPATAKDAARREAAPFSNRAARPRATTRTRWSFWPPTRLVCASWRRPHDSSWLGVRSAPIAKR